MQQSASSQGVPASYRVVPFRPDGGFDASGIVVLVSILMVAALALGVILHFVSLLFWLVLLFPPLAGMVLGATGSRAVRLARLRNPVVGGVASLLGGIMTMTAMHYAAYLQSQDDLAWELARSSGEIKALVVMPEADLREALRDAEEDVQRKVLRLRRAEHADSFPAYMNLRAEEGVTISHWNLPRAKSDMHLDFVGSWICWSMEALIVAGATFFMVRRATFEPYCVLCDHWKTKHAAGTFAAPAAEAKAALESGSLAQWLQCNPGGTVPEFAGLLVTLAYCPHCVRNATVDVKLEDISPNIKGRTQRQTIAYVTYPAEAKPGLEAVFASSSRTIAPSARA